CQARACNQIGGAAAVSGRRSRNVSTLALGASLEGLGTEEPLGNEHVQEKTGAEGPRTAIPGPRSAAVDNLLLCCARRWPLSAVDLPERNEPLDVLIWPRHHARAHFAPMRRVHLAHPVRARPDCDDNRDVAVLAIQAARPKHRDRTDRGAI